MPWTTEAKSFGLSHPTTQISCLFNFFNSVAASASRIAIGMTAKLAKCSGVRGKRVDSRGHQGSVIGITIACDRSDLAVYGGVVQM